MIDDIESNIKLTYTIEDMARTFRETRESKGLSQRGLSERSGLRQYQISKFENGDIDLRLSSLIALARALDLELTLVPRKSLSAVNTIIRGSEARGGIAYAKGEEWRRWLNTLNDLVNQNPRTKKDYAQIVNLSRAIAHFPLSTSDHDELRAIYIKLISHPDGSEKDRLARDTVSYLRKLRNRLAHNIHTSDTDMVRAAYSLDDDDHG